MKKILSFLDERFEEVVGVVLLGVVVTLIFIGVLFRLLLHDGLPWQEEISRIFFVILIYFGASYGIKNNDHIRITILYDMLPKKAQKWLDGLTDLAWIAFNVVVVLYAWETLQDMMLFPAHSGVLRIPLHWIFAIIPITFALLTLRILQNFLKRILVSWKTP